MANINHNRTSLLSACKNKDLELVKSLLENGANPNAVGNEFFTPLHWACTSKSDVTVTIIELLLQHNANIEATGGTNNWTPLFTACIHNNDVAVKCLLENHANPNATEQMGCTPLHYTVDLNCSISIAQLLLQYNANIEAAGWEGRTPFLEACYNCNYVAAKFLLDNHANPFAIDDKGYTSLHLACQRKNDMTVTLIELLLQHHVNIEAANTEGTTPLYIACNHNNYDAIEYLLDHHANIEAVDELNMTPLILACRKGNYETMKYLLDHRANIEAVDILGATPLRIACDDDNYDAIEYLLDHHANIEAVDSTVSTIFIAACNNDKHNAIKPLLDFEKYRKFKILHHYAYDCTKTPLHFACKSQKLDLVKSLLKNGENPNAVDDQMNTPLHWACTSKTDVTVTIIELLLQHNANIEAAENECGWTPLITACIHNNDVAVKCLLENQADSNAMDWMGYTPLHWIFFCNSDDIALRIAQLLLQYHANIEARSHNGRTPFLMACWNCNYAGAKFFLDNHANSFTADDDGCTSLHFVCDRKNDVTVTLLELLLQHYANIEAVDKKGLTPLMVASNRGNCKAIQCLFYHYANVNHSDINNSTALHIAIERQSVEMTECLIKCNADINLLDKENQTPLEKALKMRSSRYYPSKIIEILIYEVAKLKVAGIKIHDQNLNILDNPDRRWSISIDQSRLTNEIDQLKRENIDNNEITFYDFIKNDIRFLCQFVDDEKIQQQIEQEYLDKQFRSYIDIVRNRFREAIIQCTRNELINQAKEYFRLYINQQLPYEILDCIFIPLSNSELKVFVKSCQEAIE